ncbi:MAG: hypothetical protein KAI71_04085 [Candidatus Pacebacteria bacterium]|nr:hypothetical protein [Candidatus Paceibacterota bacterium]
MTNTKKEEDINLKITMPIRKLATEFAGKINMVYKNFEENEDDYEPLDGDGTENIAELFLLELDILNGNITQREYEEKLAKLNEFYFYWENR